MVWTLAILLILLFGGMGAFAGLAPAACGLVLVLLALVLGKWLAPLAAMVLPKEFVNHPLAAWFPDSMYFMELVLVMFVFYLLAWGFGFWIRAKIDNWLNIVGTELQRMTWKYLNHGVGFFFGLVSATIFLLTIAIGAYAPGYLSTQTTPSESEQPWGIAYLNSFRTGMAETGLDKIASRWDKTPKKYFEACDMVGLIVNNPDTMYRVEHYAPIYAMMDRSEVSDLVHDQSLRDSMRSSAGGWTYFNNGSVLNFINSGSYSELRDSIDMKDFVNYLKTGKSEKFDNYHLLGEWELDVDSVVLLAKKNKPDITYREMKFLSSLLRTYFDTTVVRFTVDKRVVMRDIISGVGELNATISNPAEPKIVPPEMIPAEIKQGQAAAMRTQAGMAQAPRSGTVAGIRRMVGGGIDHNARTQEMLNDDQVEYNDDGTVKKPEPPKIKKISASGSWSGDGDLYKIRFGDVQMDAIIEGDILTMSAGNARLFFVRRY